MQSKNRFLIFSLAGFLTLLLLSRAIKPVSGSGLTELNSYAPLSNYLLSDSDQTGACMAMLAEAAQQAGLDGETETYNFDGGCHFGVDLKREGGLPSAYLNIYPVDMSASECSEPWEIKGHTSFHGYPAFVEQISTSNNQKNFAWKMYKGGTCYMLNVMTFIYDIERYGSAPDPLPIADAMWSIAENRLPLTEGSFDGAEEPFLPVDPVEVIPDYSEVPTDPTIPTDPADTDGLFDIPWPIVLGSFSIPVIGAIAGTVFSTILSGFSSAATSSAPVSNAVASAPPVTTAKPQTGSANPDGLYWSERPWDEAGPGFVPKEEYERTKGFLEKGYKWDHGNWRAPKEIRQNDQLAQNNRDAVAKEDAAQRAKMESERQALEQNKAELKKKADDLQAAEDKLNMLEMEDDLDLINEELKKDKVYVLNPYQGDPTVLFHKLNTVKNMVWDNTAAHLTGSQGLTCEGYVRKTHKKVIEAVSKRFPGAKVEQYVIEEKSSDNPKGVLDWFDSLIPDNHILTKVTLPDGSEWAVDFHQKNAGNSPLMRPWSETRKAWKDYMGDEYMEGPNVLKY